VIAAVLVLAAAVQPFSHKLHLKLKLDCATCHAKAAPSTRLSDNLLPERQVCLKCHQDAAIPPPPPAATLARFNHSLHLKMGNLAPVIAKAIDSGAYLSPPGDTRRHLNTKNACAACHRGMEESDAVTRANLPRMADCLVCHNQIEPPFSCEKCHDNVARLVPASHTPQWVDIHSSGKANLDKQSCAVCHGRKFTCQGCH
jgi:hypothetical protein